MRMCLVNANMLYRVLVLLNPFLPFSNDHRGSLKFHNLAPFNQELFSLKLKSQAVVVGALGS